MKHNFSISSEQIAYSPVTTDYAVLATKHLWEDIRMDLHQTQSAAGDYTKLITKLFIHHHHHHHHHKHQGLDPLICSVSRVTGAHANAFSVFQLFSFLVVCSGMISKGFIH